MKKESNYNVLVAVTGGIAAYKSAELVRELTKQGAQVQVLMTEAAKAFITPLTMQALSGRAVRTGLLDEAAELGMGHIELARWADHIVIAPASADSMARIAAGLANDLLTTVLLAYQGAVSIAPAMNQAMWLNPVTRENMRKLKQFYPHWQWIGPDAGDQACGDVGPGRMSEPEEIAAQVLHQRNGLLSGKRVVITAGPTRERMDPVRYISNFSSGKMGYALAARARLAGAEVTLVSGPVSLSTPPGVTRIDVESAGEMFDCVQHCMSACDVFIATAAVADYRPEHQSDQKIKKQSDAGITVLMAQNPDILASVAAMKNNRPLVVGFAAETENVIEFGRKKLLAKGLDLIVVNDVSVEGLGFGSEENQVTLLSKRDDLAYGPAPKSEVASWLLKQIATYL